MLFHLPSSGGGMGLEAGIKASVLCPQNCIISYQLCCKRYMTVHLIFKSQHFCYISLFTGSYCIYLFTLICLSNFFVDEYVSMPVVLIIVNRIQLKYIYITFLIFFLSKFNQFKFVLAFLSPSDYGNIRTKMSINLVLLKVFSWNLCLFYWGWGMWVGVNLPYSGSMTTHVLRLLTTLSSCGFLLAIIKI